MGPGDELAPEVLGDRVALDEAGEQALAEQLHDRFGVPAPERVKGPVVAEASIRSQQVSVRGGAELLAHVLGDGLGGALRKVEEKLPTLPEDAVQEAWHGEHDVAMGDGREHILL